jgi:hypothetical protein
MNWKSLLPWLLMTATTTEKSKNANDLVEKGDAVRDHQMASIAAAALPLAPVARVPLRCAISYRWFQTNSVRPPLEVNGNLRWQ